MRIQHNVPALNAHRNLTGNNNALTKNLEKLSSGFRINRAGDDAAGLAISEKMRAQITGLQTAQKNAEDGVSLVQTAEGALTEVHSMLNRMVELATQSANGTYTESNRAEMQKEIDALTKEIDRISNTANFNGTKLFSKSPDLITKATWGEQELTSTKVQVADVYKTGAVTFSTGAAAKATITYIDKNGSEQTAEVSFTPLTGAKETAEAFITAANQVTGFKDLFTVAGDEHGLTFTAKAVGANGGKVTNVAITQGDATIGTGSTDVAGADDVTAFDLSANAKPGDQITIDGKTYTYAKGADGNDGKTFVDLDTLKVAAAKNGVTLNIATPAAVTATKANADNAVNIDLHVGESSSKDNTIAVTIKAMSSTSLGIDSAKMNIKDAASAKDAIDTVNTAIDTVSSIRSDLGALQNRLEHTINNLGVQTENITAAESRIRDVDMAKEMMAYTKNNILVQASQAMLAQANQVPQGVLQLLQ